MALVGALVGHLLSEAIAGSPTGQGDATPFVQTVGKGAIQLSVIGAALAIWLSYLCGDSPAEIARLGLVGLIVGGLGGALAGAIWGARLLPDARLAQANINQLGVASDLVVGGFLGALIGGLWIPRRVTVGVGLGLAAGALFRWAEIYNFSPNGAQDRVTVGVVKAVVITVVVLGVLAALDAAARSRSTGHARSPRG